MQTDGDRPRTGHAVVIGAGMAGIAAARVLSRRYARVTVLDRDELPGDAAPRRGVPQGNHGHILLISGLRALDGLFPGLADDLTAAGAVRFDIGTGLCQYRFGSRQPVTATGLELLSISRPRLEALLRARIAAEPGTTLRDGIAISGLAGAGDRVTGVVLDTGETVPADLVVDCSGRGSRSDRWLEALGFPAPEQVEVRVGVTYTTRFYRRGAGDLSDWQGAFVLPAPPTENRVGLMLPVEGDRWLVSLGGWHVDNPPVDGESFHAYAATLPDPVISDVISRAEPLSEPVLFRFPSSRRRQFERLARVPAGYVALGDAICSFNPVYGQGMTCAAQEAVALGRMLDKHRGASAAMAGDFYRAAAQIIATPWRFAVGGDFGYPRTTGPRPRAIRLKNWYSRQIQLACKVSPEVYGTFVAVQQLVTPPAVLFRPAFVARVLRHTWRRRTG